MMLLGDFVASVELLRPWILAPVWIAGVVMGACLIASLMYSGYMRAHSRMWVLPVVITIIFFAFGFGAAGPEWKSFEERKEFRGACVGIMIDVSLSMLAPMERGKKETRLERARLEIAFLVRSLTANDRIALGVFAQEARMFPHAWSTDHERMFLSQLDTITTSYVRLYGRSGSNIAGALRTLIASFPADKPCQNFGLVFTDGEPEGDASFLGQQRITMLEDFSQSSSRMSYIIVAIGDPRISMRIPEYDLDGVLVGHETNDAGEFILTIPHLDSLKDFAVTFHAEVIASHKGAALHQRIANAMTDIREVESIRRVETRVSIAHYFGAIAVLLLMLMLAV